MNFLNIDNHGKKPKFDKQVAVHRQKAITVVDEMKRCHLWTSLVIA